MDTPRLPALITSGTLVATAGVHLAWALGSPWPFADRETWRESVFEESMREPDALAYAAVVSALLAGSASVLAADGVRVPGWSLLPARLRSAAPWGVAGVVGARGALGLVLFPGDRGGARFARLNRRYYSPLCLALAAGAAWSAAQRRDQR